MSGNKSETTLELQDVCSKLQETKSAIEVGVDSLESGKKARDVQKKEILLRQMKQVLATLNDTETNVIKDLKGEAFDLIKSISKISGALSALQEIVCNGTKYDAKWKEDVETLKGEVNNLKLDGFLSSLDMSVSIHPGSMATALEKFSDAIFLHTPVLHPKQFLLELPERLPSFQTANYDPKFIDIQIFTITEGLAFNPIVLRQLMLVVTCMVPGQGKVVLEESSVWTKIEKNKAWLSEGGGLVTIQLKRPNPSIGKISIRVLGSDIVNSPLIHQFINEENTDPTFHNLTLAKDSIGIFDTTGLDESDLASLDMTTRREMLLSAGEQQRLANPTFQVCQSLRPLSRQPNIPSVSDSRIVNSPILQQLCHGYPEIDLGGVLNAPDKISKEPINTHISDALDHDSLSQYITSTFSPHSRKTLIKARQAAAVQLDIAIFRVFEDGS